MPALNKYSLIAPCGMNCGVCRAHLRDKNKCLGCRCADAHKPVTRVRCKIKTCQVFRTGKAKFCFECKQFPCDILKRFDKRYKTNFHMSTIENLENIRSLGIRKFLKNEDVRWTCRHCGGTICVHSGYCVICSTKKAKPTA